MLSSEDQNPWRSKRHSTQRLVNEFCNKNWKYKLWTTFCERCTQPVQSNALQEAVGHRLTVTLTAGNIATVEDTAKVKLYIL